VRYIRKGAEPAKFRRWKIDNPALTGREAYRNLSAEAKAALRDQMLKEQGHLCAYTMMRIGGEERIHIEHIKPQRHYPDLAIDYSNMVACATGNKHLTYPFGAVAKGDTDITPETFVSPLHKSCETRFRFDFNGEVAAASTNEIAATATIELLKLNHATLVAIRKRAFDELVLGVGGRKPASAAEARRIAQDVLTPDASGRLPSFCVALRQVATAIADRREQLAGRLASRVDR
jgi:uncharacterized protein (TIGR02646 family)